MEFKNILAIVFSYLISCALSNVLLERDWRIVGGEDAPDHAYPHQVSIQYKYPSQTGGVRHFCGGAIVSNNYVLSAAHCLYAKTNQVAELTVMAGTNLQNDLGVDGGGTAVWFDCAEIIVNPQFDPSTMVADIALIRLASSITFGPTIRAIPLPKQDHADPITTVLTGWGYTNSSYVVPNRLQRIELASMDVVQCDTYMTSWRVNECHVCTTAPEGKGACFGDSGGPLHKHSDGTLIGLVSFGYPCALGKPDVYCRVQCYTDWITETITGGN